jgi:hypothetical protein
MDMAVTLVLSALIIAATMATIVVMVAVLHRKPSTYSPKPTLLDDFLEKRRHCVEIAEDERDQAPLQPRDGDAEQAPRQLH